MPRNASTPAVRRPRSRPPVVSISMRPSVRRRCRIEPHRDMIRRIQTAKYSHLVDALTLDELDRQLVHALQVDGRAPFSAIAAVLGVSERTLARRYRRLRQAGAVRVVGLPDAARLGQTDWFVRIQCGPDAVSPVAAALARRPDTAWVTLLSGGTEITCITRTAGTARDNLLLRKLPRTPRITAVTAQCLLRPVAGLSGWYGRVTALRPDQIDALRPPPAASAPTALDQLDRRLLDQLALDGRTPLPVLAAHTAAAETTLRRRLRSLRDNGIVYFDVEADPPLFGYRTQAVLWLTVAPDQLAATATTLARHPEIAFAAATTGPTNLLAFLVCRDNDTLYEYLTTRIGTLPGIRHTETAPISSYTKRAGTPLP
jgi:DNA-binding Lrp family transcriptional regulator